MRLLLLLAWAPCCAGSFSVGTEQLRFAVTNSSQARWGCLSGVFLGGDPHPTENGVLRAGGAGATPLWRLTATGCNASFPAAALALDSCTASCARKYLVEQTATTAHMRWERCGSTLPDAAGHPATLDVDVTVSVAGGRSTWTGTIGKEHAAGVCLQSFALPSMESLRFAPDREELFVPFAFGATGSSAQSRWGGWGSPHPEIAGVHEVGDQQELIWMPNGFGRTMSWAGWFSPAEPGAASTRGGIGLYLGVHDPLSRLKMLPVAPDPQGGETANLRAVHVPENFFDASTDTFTIPYEVVVATVRGGWWVRDFD